MQGQWIGAYFTVSVIEVNIKTAKLRINNDMMIDLSSVH